MSTYHKMSMVSYKINHFVNGPMVLAFLDFSLKRPGRRHPVKRTEWTSAQIRN